ALGRRCIAIQANVSQEEEVNRLFAEANQAFGPITVLVNNAGTTRDKLILQMSLADFEHVIDSNLRSAFLCTKAALRGMMRARWGRIVNVSSIAGVLGSAGQANYAASKSAILGLTLSTAREMATRNITANDIAPGFVPTELTSTLTEQQREYIRHSTPHRQYASLADRRRLRAESSPSPAGLGHARDQAVAGNVAETDAADAELEVQGPRPAAQRAAQPRADPLPRGHHLAGVAVGD